MNKEILIERIITLCEERDINLTTAFVESGVGKNFRSNLKSSNPSDKNLNLLAKYFNVSVDYLLGNETEEDLAMNAFYQVRAWLEDNGYDIRVSEYDLYTIDKDGQQTNLFFEDLLVMSGDIKKRSEQGFELAMLEWERKTFAEKTNVALSDEEAYILKKFRDATRDKKAKIYQAILNICDGF